MTEVITDIPEQLTDHISKEASLYEGTALVELLHIINGAQDYKAILLQTE